MPSQGRITGAGFLFAIVAVTFIGGCGEQVAPKAKEEAVKLTPEQEFAAKLKKAEAGDASAQFDLGEAYYFGADGAPRDDAKVFEWWQKAGEQG